MKHAFTLRYGLPAMSLGSAALPTLADDDCNAPMDRWQSREAVWQVATRESWQIQSPNPKKKHHEIQTSSHPLGHRLHRWSPFSKSYPSRIP
ncbi:PepSY domain-containing protein [Acidovorax sp.]|jgi:hypothetical protein|uniref:PepSY domain-containing protein n=1 Tax=Acidovorax sp. TaxID=1872122 RepID=UPI0025BA9ED0|nr:PepSY domain-containing protein [Acidovorax sp.]MBL7091232.1 PepSY domain-containing protein [Acidovorax sp.]